MPSVLAISAAVVRRAMRARSLQRGLMVFLAVTFFFTTSGVTIVTRDLRDDRDSASVADEWYPCKGHHCGCTSAEACRMNCCCHLPPVQSRPAAARSHAHGTYEASQGSAKTHGAAAVVFRLVMRSQSCGGNEMVQVLKCECPLVPIARFTCRLLVRPERADAHQSLISDLYSLTPDPPPPRVC